LLERNDVIGKGKYVIVLPPQSDSVQPLIMTKDRL
jgi:hypothetical protein